MEGDAPPDDKRRPGPQVASTEHYFDADYLTAERFYSFGVQIELVRSLEPGSVLEIGPGPGVVGSVLAPRVERYWTVDLDPRVAPDVVADVGRLPWPDAAADVGLCAEVMEHLPFHRAEAALRELRRVCRRGAVVSVPDIRPFYEVRLVVPKLRWHRRFPVPWARPRPHPFDGEHYWVLGAEGYPVERLRTAMTEAGWDVVEERRPDPNPYHHFFVLR